MSGRERDSRRLAPEMAAAKRRAGSISVAFNVVSTVVKLGAAVASGSVSLLSEAVHSSTDIVTSLLAAYGVRAAAVPPDDDHPYGHGKIEALGGFGEALLLFVVVGYVVWESIQRILHPQPVRHIDLALLVMGVSMLGAWAVARHVLGVACRTGSLALEGNGRHLSVDAVTSGGVVAGLLITRATGWEYADPMVALLLAAWIAWGAWRLAREATQQLIDRKLPESELERISELVGGDTEVLSFHRLRTRRSGDIRFVDLHIVMRADCSLLGAHDCADRLERTIEAALTPAHVVIHVDPFDPAKHESGV